MEVGAYTLTHKSECTHQQVYKSTQQIDQSIIISKDTDSKCTMKNMIHIQISSVHAGMQTGLHMKTRIHTTDIHLQTAEIWETRH